MMPLYGLRCTEGHDEERFVPLSAYYDPLGACHKCGAALQRTITVPHIINGSQYDYVSVIDGSHIGSKTAHREHLRTHNMIELGNEVPKPAAERPFDWKSAIGETYAELKVTGKIND